MNKDNLSKTLSVVDKLSQKSVIQYFKEIDWRVGSTHPFVVELDPTSRCNLACPDCISGELLNKDELSPERLISLAEEMVRIGVRAVILIGGGEPMMHPSIGKVIEILGIGKVSIGITTNGLFLKKYLDLVRRYASWVRVSMDAGTDATFNRLRPSKIGKSLFKQVIDNMEAYARVKTGKLGYSFMVYSEGNYGFKGIPVNFKGKEHLKEIKSNAHEIFMAAKLAKDIGCDYFEIKPMYDVNHFAVIQPPEVVKMVDEQILLAKTLETKSFKVLEATKLIASLHGDSNIEKKDYKRCLATHSRTLITPSGTYVCPYFRGSPNKLIGKIQDQTLSDLWHSQERASVMKLLDPSKDCLMHCIRNDFNLRIESWLSGGFPLPAEDFDLFI